MEASKILFVPLNKNFLNTNKVCGESLNIMQTIFLDRAQFFKQKVLN